MNVSTRCLLVMALCLGLFGPALGAVTWSYHPTYPGTLTVYGTIDCQRIEPPLWSGPVVVCTNYTGPLPSWANDCEMEFSIDPAYCPNHNKGHKVAVPQYDSNWSLLPLVDWMEQNIEDYIYVPVIMDVGGAVPVVYSVVDLQQWLADPRPAQDYYTIVDGTCPDLPGYLIGTTPIVFTPEAGPTENPFSTTPFTGELTMMAIQDFSPEPGTLGLLALGALALIRRRSTVK